jgi:hypothetical protein
MKKSLALLLSALILFAACKNQTDKKLSPDEILKKVSSSPGMNAGTGGFDINVPSGWLKKDTSLNGIKVTLLSSPAVEGQFNDNINVVSEAMQGYSLDKYIEATIAGMEKYMQGYSVIGKGEKTIDGRPARFIHYLQTPNGLSLEAMVYIVPNNDIAYIITCTSPKGQLDKIIPQFDETMASFKLH